jgi:hypothetical protein
VARHARARTDHLDEQVEARVVRAPENPTSTGAPPDLDRLIHERMRLGIVSALAVNECLSFNDLKKLLGTTDGRLHLQQQVLRRTHPQDGVPPDRLRATGPGPLPRPHGGADPRHTPTLAPVFFWSKTL